MDFIFRFSAIKIRKNMYISILNNQTNTYMQHTPAVVAPAVAPVVAPVVAPAVAPVVVPITPNNNKLPKKGFNVILSKIKQ